MINILLFDSIFYARLLKVKARILVSSFAVLLKSQYHDEVTSRKLYKRSDSHQGEQQSPVSV